MRVLHVSAGAERGGLEVIFLNILKCLDRSRFDPEVLFLSDGPFVKEVQDAGVKTHVVQAGRVRQLLKGTRSLGQVVGLIRDREIDIVHTHNAKAHVYGGLAARFAGRPCLLHLQGAAWPSFSRDGFVSFLSVVVPAHQTIACSKWVAAAFTSAWHLKRHVRVVYSGVLTEGLRANGGEVSVRREFAISENTPLVVMATRLQRWKGVHLFVDAAARVIREWPNAHFMIVGGSLFGLEADYADELRDQVRSLGLERSVVFTGFRADVADFFRAADVVVHSSIEPDPLPTVILEAMLESKPVVAPDLGGPSEMIENNVTGLLVTPNDAEALAESIKSMLGDDERRVRFGEAGAARVRERFSAERMTQEIMDIYSVLMNRRGMGG